MTTSDDYLIGILLKLRVRARLDGLMTKIEVELLTAGLVVRCTSFAKRWC